MVKGSTSYEDSESFFLCTTLVTGRQNYHLVLFVCLLICFNVSKYQDLIFDLVLQQWVQTIPNLFHRCGRLRPWKVKVRTTVWLYCARIQVFLFAWIPTCWQQARLCGYEINRSKCCIVCIVLSRHVPLCNPSDQQWSLMFITLNDLTYFYYPLDILMLGLQSAEFAS